MSHSPVSTQTSTRPPSRVSCEFDSWYQELGIHSIEDIPARCSSLIEWTKTKPLFILQLDPVDRAILRIADERDEIQKKTFTKWVNKHLFKANRRVVDLYEDLRDGENLVSLLEVLSQEILPRERGRMRVHMLQNVQNALDFLTRRRIKLVNIRPDDIVDSNQKLILGLIWTIILHYQISDIIQHDDNTTFKEALLRWAQKTTEGYPGVKVTDFTNSWKDGLAFNAILHRNRPDLLDYRNCSTRNNRENLENAFRIGERDLGVTRLLEPEDVDTKNIDEKSMITYISSLYELFPEPPERNPYLDDEKIRRAFKDFQECYNSLHSWMVAKDKMFAVLGPIPAEPRTIATQKQQCQVIREEFKSQEKSLQRFDDCGEICKRLLERSSIEYKEVDDQMAEIHEHWNRLLDQLSGRERALSVASDAASRYQQKLATLTQWLEKSEHRLVTLSSIPSDKDRIRQRISEHRAFHRDILNHKHDFDDLTETAQNLMSSIGDDEARVVTSQVRGVTDRYAKLIKDSENLSHELSESHDSCAFNETLLRWAQRTTEGYPGVKVTDFTNSWKDGLAFNAILHRNRPDLLDYRDCSGRSNRDNLENAFRIGERDLRIKRVLQPEEVDSKNVDEKGMIKYLTSLYEMFPEPPKRNPYLDDEKIRRAFKDFQECYNSLHSWMVAKDKMFAVLGPIPAEPRIITTQRQQCQVIREEFNTQKKALQRFDDCGEICKRLLERSSMEYKQVDDQMADIHDHWNKLLDQLSGRERALSVASDAASKYQQKISALTQWLEKSEHRLMSLSAIPTDKEQIRQRISEHRALHRDILSKKHDFEDLTEIAQNLMSLIGDDEAQNVVSRLRDVTDRYAKLIKDSENLAHELTDSVESKAFNEALLRWAQRTTEGYPGVKVTDFTNSWKDGLAFNAILHRNRPDLLDYRACSNRDNRGNLENAFRIGERDLGVKRTLEPSEVDSNNVDEKAMIKYIANLYELFPEPPRRNPYLDDEKIRQAFKDFQDCYNSLHSWMVAKDKMFAVLGPIPAEPRIIANQKQQCQVIREEFRTQEKALQRFDDCGDICKRLLDRSSMEYKQVDDQMADIHEHWDRLLDQLSERERTLSIASDAASKYHQKIAALTQWLDNSEHRLMSLSKIPTDQDQIRQRISEHRALHLDILSKKHDFEDLTEIAQNLMSLIGDDEAQMVVDRLRGVTDRYAKLVEDSENFLHLLSDYHESLGSFVLSFEDILAWIEEIDSRLDRFRALSVYLDKLREQLDELDEINEEIEEHQKQIIEVNNTGQEVMKHASGGDAIQIKEKLNALNARYDELANKASEKLRQAQDALPLCDNFHSAHDRLNTWMDESERALKSSASLSLNVQEATIQRLEAELPKYRSLLEQINHLGPQLGAISPGQGAAAVDNMVNRANRRFEAICEQIQIISRQNELENASLRLGQFRHALDEFLTWMSRTEMALDEIKPTFADAQVIEVDTAKLKVLINDIAAHQTNVDTLNRAGKMLIESDRGSEEASATAAELNKLNTRWQQLQDKAAQRQRELEDILKEVMAFNQEIQDLLMWLSDIDGQFVASKPVGGLPETAREQLNRFMELYSELDVNRHKLESVLKQGQEYLKKAPESNTPTLQHNLKTLKTRWDSILNRANDRKIKLEIALREATEFHEAVQEFVEWLSSAEKYLNNMGPVSLVMEHILPQIEEHKNFQKDVSNHRETMLNLDKKGTHLKYFSQKQDVIIIKNLLVSVQHRWERVVGKAAERTRALDRGYKEAREFHDAWSSLISWLKNAEEQLDNYQPAGNDPERIKLHLMKHKEFQRALGAKQSTYDATIKLGRTLKDKCPKSDVPILNDMIEELKQRWNSACAKSVDRQRKLEEALLFSGQFKDAVQALIDWLDKAKGRLGLDRLHGDLDTVTVLVEQHRAFQDDLKSRQKNMTTVKKTANDLLDSATPSDAALIREQLVTLDSRWEEVVRMSDAKQRCLEAALKQAEELHKAVHQNLEWLSDAEMKLRNAGPLPDDEETTKQQITEHEMFIREMSKQEVNKDSTISLAEDILAKCHPDAVSVIRHWITIIQSRWEEISNWAKQREAKLKEHLRSLRDLMSILEELLAWLRKAEADLLAAESEPLPDDIESLEGLIEEHQKFIDEMSAKQPEVERVTKASSTVPKSKSSDVKGRRSTSKTRDSSINSRAGSEPEIKNPKARELVEKWRNVWLLAMERMRRLQDKLDYIREVERVKNFDFDEWRRRFLGWMNNKKARVMDFFRKIDKDNDGKVTQEDFIEGFLASKFPTSRLEMERVAPIFDRNSDGFIDHKEYLETLRPDRDLPKTEAEIIQDEVQRQVAKCTCVHRYKVFQVGEGKYRFGDSQKLRLVRILRSTVMVRVGGGWVSLDEFLIKNDPCRAKGRTNVELREQFILADGVSQGMAAFKSKPVINPKTGAISTVGPIIKIREKTQLSVPMSRSYRFGGSTSDCSFSDTDSGSKSRPGSRMAVEK
ncbi:dystonin isoform X3 [Tetranychus urticae]|uniref:dystonin isoform X3 n=1 Tax=Tetranychus urticae TaxID=32264 RepID=UPI00077BD0CB|nr:dystonin isoform X3 [Tetranychus urticae]